MRVKADHIPLVWPPQRPCAIAAEAKQHPPAKARGAENVSNAAVFTGYSRLNLCLLPSYPSNATMQRNSAAIARLAKDQDETHAHADPNAGRAWRGGIQRAY